MKVLQPLRSLNVRPACLTSSDASNFPQTPGTLLLSSSTPPSCSVSASHLSRNSNPRQTGHHSLWSCPGRNRSHIPLSPLHTSAQPNHVCQTAPDTRSELSLSPVDSGMSVDRTIARIPQVRPRTLPPPLAQHPAPGNLGALDHHTGQRSHLPTV